MDKVIETIKGFEIHLSIDEREEKMYFYASKKGMFGDKIKDESFFNLRKKIIKHTSSTFNRFDVFVVKGLFGYGYSSNCIFEKAQVTSIDGDHVWIKYYNDKYGRERIESKYVIFVNDETIKLKEIFEKEEEKREATFKHFVSFKESFEKDMLKRKDFFIKFSKKQD